jgi:hypothetical protein
VDTEQLRAWADRLRPTTGACLVALAAVALTARPAGAQSCSPDLAETCNTAATCGTTVDDVNDPHFQVQFLGRVFNAGPNTTTFSYRICKLQNPNMQHWVLGLCPALLSRVVGFTPSGGGSGIETPVSE